jgi:hypothetical protein
LFQRNKAGANEGMGFVKWKICLLMKLSSSSPFITSAIYGCRNGFFQHFHFVCKLRAISQIHILPLEFKYNHCQQWHSLHQLIVLPAGMHS